ncbi:hypothetical protein HPB47_006715 [Ixodes persulcatus]|uniref:Uncharacterized protein n=1 Tax=Ixodes persulcatus TaxID=34615 RepID=A0AC60P9I6_IXOPE|nr:hypothetical protein HPB47_006715 [Ixodes persulcatus]
MCLRYKFVDPARFHHLETLQVGWHRKRKILNDYRNCTRDHLRTGGGEWEGPSSSSSSGGQALGFGGVFGHLDDPKLEIRV